MGKSRKRTRKGGDIFNPFTWFSGPSPEKPANVTTPVKSTTAGLGSFTDPTTERIPMTKEQGRMMEPPQNPSNMRNQSQSGAKTEGNRSRGLGGGSRRRRKTKKSIRRKKRFV